MLTLQAHYNYTYPQYSASMVMEKDSKAIEYYIA